VTFAIATSAVKSSPGDWRGWYLVLASAGEAPANQALRKEAIERLASAPPDDVMVLHELTWALLGQGEDGRAVAIAARAVKLAPWEPSVIDAWAVVQASLGQCKEALAAIRRAVDLVTDERGGARGAFEERQRLIEKQCAPAVAPPKAKG
jgi:predicted Zn-dependent protease